MSSSSLNGHDRVTRYASVDEAAFRALVGDDINGLFEIIKDIAEGVGTLRQTISARTIGIFTTVIMLLAGVIADIMVRAQ